MPEKPVVKADYTEVLAKKASIGGARADLLPKIAGLFKPSGAKRLSSLIMECQKKASQHKREGHGLIEKQWRSVESILKSLREQIRADKKKLAKIDDEQEKEHRRQKLPGRYQRHTFVASAFERVIEV